MREISGNENVDRQTSRWHHNPTNQLRWSGHDKIYCTLRVSQILSYSFKQYNFETTLVVEHDSYQPSREIPTPNILSIFAAISEIKGDVNSGKSRIRQIPAFTSNNEQNTQHKREAA